MRTDLINSVIEYTVNGTVRSLSVSHPSVSEERRGVVDRYRASGCELVVDLEKLPKWAGGLPGEAQAAALDCMPELFQYCKLRVPQSASLTHEDWRRLPHLAELRYLSVSSAVLTPADVANVVLLHELETLVLHGPSVDDTFCAAFPRVSQLLALDVLGTPITASGFRALRQACPNAKIYADCDA